MPFLESLKQVAERLTGIGRPTRRELARLKRPIRPAAHHFRPDRRIPNNQRFAVLIYRSAIRLDERYDPAAIVEEIFSANGWSGAWRDGIYPFRHFHTKTHEVLGIARGDVRVEIGGGSGKRFDLRAGDVIVLPAGTSHRRLRASKDLLVVGAYPAGGSYDEPKAGEIDVDAAAQSVRTVRKPARDPVFGTRGPLTERWRVRRPS